MCGPLSNEVLESANRCSKCSYNLTGLTEPRCPECGTGFGNRPAPNLSIAGEHVLIFINASALVLAAPVYLYLGFLPDGDSPPFADVFLLAMLAPLQWVLGLAGIVVGIFLLSRARSMLIAIVGISLPLLAGSWSIFLIFRASLP